MTLGLTKMPERYAHADDGAGRIGHGGESSFSANLSPQRRNVSCKRKDGHVHH